MVPTAGQFTASSPPPAMPAPSTPPTTACVVETGAPSQVDRFTHRAAAIIAQIITRTNPSEVAKPSGATMPPAMVSTTSPPASTAPRLSNTAAISSAPPMVSTLAPTAGPTLLATSLAPMLSAM